MQSVKNLRIRGMKVVVFDSGVGGFSILRLLLQYPHEFIYLADQAHFPYGDKSELELQSRLIKLAHWLKLENPDLVVMACNTATVSGIEILRKSLSCPIVGVEPVIKPAAQFPKAMILGTQVTLSSSRTGKLMSSHQGSIISYTPHGLANAIENNNIEQVKNILKKIKIIVQKEKISALGLSCTHYPLIKDLVSKLIPHVYIIDPSQAVADRVAALLKRTKSNKTVPSCIFYTTGDVLRFNHQISQYLGMQTKSKKVVL